MPAARPRKQQDANAPPRYSMVTPKGSVMTRTPPVS